MKPISPKKVIKQIDQNMIKSVNEMIAENLIGRVSSFSQSGLIDRYLKNANVVGDRTEKVQDLFDRKQLDFEKLYTEKGWKVRYVNDNKTSEDPTFEFRVKKKHVKKYNGSKNVKVLTFESIK